MAHKSVQDRIDRLIDDVAQNPEHADVAKQKISELARFGLAEAPKTYEYYSDNGADDDMWDNLPV